MSHKILSNISLFFNDISILKSQIKWFSLLEPMFDKLFGEGWRKTDKDFWDEFDDRHLKARDNIQRMG